ncbi:CHAT domain-containing protein [Streptomyces pactum]|uniref:CHAT domain-containing protein n=1 Tax=Streptomyces pactum TaxID=68249 RepID=UPI0036FBA2F1
MPEREYDLAALCSEVQQQGVGGVVDVRTMSRMCALVCERVGRDTPREAFARLYADWRAGPRGTAQSGAAAGIVLMLVPVLQYGGPCADPGQVTELLSAFLADGPADPLYQGTVLAGVGVTALTGLFGTEPAVRETALSRLERARELLAGRPAGVAVAVVHAILRAQLATLGAGTDHLDAAVADLAGLLTSPELLHSPLVGPEGRQELAGFLALFRSEQARRHDDGAALRRAGRELEEVLERLPADHGSRAFFGNALHMVRDAERWSEAQRTGRLPWGAEATRPVAPVEGVRRQGEGLADSARADHLSVRGHTLLRQALLSGEVPAAEEAMGLLADAVELLEPDDQRWLMCAGTLGSAHLTLAGLPGVPEAGRQARLDQGISWLVHAHRLAGGPANPLWGGLGTGLAWAYRLRGDRRRDPVAARRDLRKARRAGLRALTGVTWSVLLQSGTPHAAQAGREAAEHALDLARWCLADGVYDEAVRALDAGRGLLLHAATVSATVPETLTALGHTDLAQEWRAAGPVPPDPVGGVRPVLGYTADGAASAAAEVHGAAGVGGAWSDGAGAGGAGGPAVPPSGQGSGPSSSLRRRVLDVLAASPHRRGLLEPPGPAEIGAALRALGAGALAYLVPGGEGVPGSALVVSADGSVRALPLPGLTADAAPLTEYRATDASGGQGPGGSAGSHDRGGRDSPHGPAGRSGRGGPAAVRGRPAPHPPTRDMGTWSTAAAAQQPGRRGTMVAALGALCDWAGPVVMDPLLRALPRGSDGSVSVVLVPVGVLGMVPWHAGRLPGAGPGATGPRHACQEARISYIPSARLLCEVAARPAPPVPAGGRPALVVGDPTRNLGNAAAEARAIHGVFCPDAPLLDHRTGTPEAVLRWLRRQHGGLLHLACHGHVRHGERHSAHLSLAGGELTAEELTEGADRFPGPDLVVLAACSTNVSGRGYDEAYSLATAFLAAGARSVLGSLWTVPDEATSLLMYMAHHYLHAERQRPGAALRRAQLWMLDERRVAPPGMPADLAERARHIDRDDLTGWAGFTHLGW